MGVNCGEVLNASFTSGAAGKQCVSHSFISDLEHWIIALSDRAETELLKSALREYEFALLAVVQGQYRQSFMALRLFLELALAAVHFSGNELQLRIWLRGGRDIGWKSLINIENGVFSKTFIDAFHDGLAEEGPRYGAIADSVYRECSEYVHGNAPTHELLPEKLIFVERVFVDWHEKARTARLVVSFALCARYLLTIGESSRKELEGIVLDQLGHIAVLRSLYGGVTEES